MSLLHVSKFVFTKIIITPCKIGRLIEPAKGRLLFGQFWIMVNINLPMMSRGGSDNIIAVHGHRWSLIKPKSKSKSLIQSQSFCLSRNIKLWRYDKLYSKHGLAWFGTI